MWILVTPQPRPDMPMWTGRRALAVVDAIGWPLLAALALHRLPWATGLLGAVMGWGLLLLAVARVRRAWWVNGSYRFTTWVWGRRLAALLLLGALAWLCLSGGAARVWS